MITVTHQIAGIIFRTESDVKLPYLEEESFEKFLINNKKPNVYHRIHYVGADSLTMSSPTIEEQAHLFRYAHNWPAGLSSSPLRSPKVRAMVLNCMNRHEHMTIQLYKNWVIIYNFDRNEVDFFYTPETAKYPAEFYVAGNFSRIFSTFLPNFSGILIHGAGMIRNDKAAVFIGAGGKGKTTITGLSEGKPILSDDQIIIRKENGVVRAYATPLTRNTSGPFQARIGGLFMIEKALYFELIPLKPPDLVQCLWAAYCNNTSLPTRNMKKRVFAVLCDTCYQSPCYLMRFPKNYVDWNAIDKVMEI